MGVTRDGAVVLPYRDAARIVSGDFQRGSVTC